MHRYLSPVASVVSTDGLTRGRMDAKTEVHAIDLYGHRPLAAELNGWIEDYNEKHPHSGLKMLSPREHIRALLEAA